MESGRSIARFKVGAPTIVAVVVVRRRAVRVKIVVTIVAVVVRIAVRRHFDIESDLKAIVLRDDRKARTRWVRCLTGQPTGEGIRGEACVILQSRASVFFSRGMDDRRKGKGTGTGREKQRTLKDLSLAH